MRFSIRDLLWLTLFVAIGLGWLVHAGRLRSSLDKVTDRATKWRMAANALKYALEEDGSHVELDFEARELFLIRTGRGMTVQESIDLTAFAPCVQDD